MFRSIGPLELVVILAVILLIFGPKNLPKLGKALGSTVKNLREGMSGDDEAEKTEEAEEELSEEDKQIAELEAKLAEAKKKKEEGAAEDSAE